MKVEKVYLVGFMAAGKTTVARGVARRLDWQPVDIDEMIERREHLSVSEIFARHGEPYFRLSERAVLTEQLGVPHLVVATGGGTFADPQNRALINADGLSIWLDIPLEQAIARLPVDGRRPLASDREAFERLYHARRSAYQQAHIHIDAGRQTSAALVEQIMDLLRG
ncbi:MAG: shikimate kinase [Acidobacteriota bacterium]